MWDTKEDKRKYQNKIMTKLTKLKHHYVTCPNCHICSFLEGAYQTIEDTLEDLQHKY